MNMMNAAVFTGPGRIILDRKPVPVAGPGEAVIKITLTTICGTDVHILKGEYPVKPGLTIGHEPVGTIHELGPGVTGYQIGQRVVVGAITPCGQCHTCLTVASRSAAATPSAATPSAAGASATRSTAVRPSILKCRSRWPTSRQSRTA